MPTLKRSMRSRGSASPVEEDFPQWIPLASAAIVAIGLSLAVAQRGAAGLTPLFAFIAALPFLLDVVALLTPLEISLPLWLFPVPVLVGGALLVWNPPANDFAPFVILYMTVEVASRSRGQLLLAVVVGVASVGVMVSADQFGNYNDPVPWLIGIPTAWFGGMLVQSLVRRTAELKDAQAGLAEKAAADERSRIAREVHDVIAHSMSVTMLHVTAARMALERGQAPEALDALQEAERQGRRSMTDIRRTVGLLGPESDSTVAPMPGVADVPKLIADFRSAGIDVTLSMDGDLSSLPPTAGLSVYRIVQESLTNVAKHAPDSDADVALRVWNDEITLRIHNATGNGDAALPTDAGGLGIRGMIERAMVLQGSLEAGPEGDGWTVLLVAPRPAIDAP